MLLPMPKNAVLSVNELSEITNRCSFITLSNQMIASKQQISPGVHQSKTTSNCPTIAHVATNIAIDRGTTPATPSAPAAAATPNNIENTYTSIETRTAADDGREEVNDGKNHPHLIGHVSTESRSGGMHKKDSEMESGIESDSEDDDVRHVTSEGLFSRLSIHFSGDRTLSSAFHCSRWTDNDETRQLENDNSTRISTGSLITALYDPSLSIDEFIAKAMIQPPPPPPTNSSTVLSTDENELATSEELIGHETDQSCICPMSIASSTFSSLPVCVDITEDLHSVALNVTLEEKYAQLVTPPPPPSMTSSNELDIDKLLSVFAQTNNGFCEVANRNVGYDNIYGNGGSPEMPVSNVLPSSRSLSIHHVEERSTCSLLPPLPPPLSLSMIDRRTTWTTSSRRSENTISTAVTTPTRSTPVVINTRSPLMLGRQMSLPVGPDYLHSPQANSDTSQQSGGSVSPPYLVAFRSSPLSHQRRLPVHGCSTPPPTLPKPANANSFGAVMRAGGLAPTLTNCVDVISTVRRPLHPPPSPPPRTSSVHNSPIVSTSGPDGGRGRDRTTNKHTMCLANRPEFTTENTICDEPRPFCNPLAVVDGRNEANLMRFLPLVVDIPRTLSPPPSPALQPHPPPLQQVTTMYDRSVVIGPISDRRDSAGSVASDTPSYGSLKIAEIRSSADQRSPLSPISEKHHTGVFNVAKTSSLPREVNSVLTAHAMGLASSTSGQGQGRSMSLSDGGKIRSGEPRSVLGSLKNKFRSYWNRNRKSQTTPAVDYDYRSSFRSADGGGRDLRRKSPSPSLLTVPSYRSFTADLRHVDVTSHVIDDYVSSNTSGGDGDDVTLSAEDNFRHWATLVDNDNDFCDDVITSGRCGRGGGGSLKSFTGNS